MKKSETNDSGVKERQCEECRKRVIWTFNNSAPKKNGDGPEAKMEKVIFDRSLKDLNEVLELQPDFAQKLVAFFRIVRKVLPGGKDITLLMVIRHVMFDDLIGGLEMITETNYCLLILDFQEGILEDLNLSNILSQLGLTEDTKHSGCSNHQTDFLADKLTSTLTNSLIEQIKMKIKTRINNMSPSYIVQIIGAYLLRCSGYQTVALFEDIMHHESLMPEQDSINYEKHSYYDVVNVLQTQVHLNIECQGYEDQITSELTTRQLKELDDNALSMCKEALFPK